MINKSVNMIASRNSHFVNVPIDRQSPSTEAFASVGTSVRPGEDLHFHGRLHLALVLPGQEQLVVLESTNKSC